MNKHLNPSIQVFRYPVGEMSVNCYIATDIATKNALIIDPGDEANYLSGEIEKQNIHPIAIIATHGHFDHILAALELQLMYNVPFRMSEADKFLLNRMSDSAEHFLGRKISELPPKVTEELHEGDVIPFGNGSLIVIQTPGHTPGSVSLYAKGLGIFVGDTIFASGGVGRTDFAYSSADDLNRSVDKILSLPDTAKIFSGHGEETSVMNEKRYHQADMFSG